MRATPYDYTYAQKNLAFIFYDRLVHSGIYIYDA